jgi:hypothetical protein
MAETGERSWIRLNPNSNRKLMMRIERIDADFKPFSVLL